MNKPTVLIISGGSSSRLFPLNEENKGYFRLMGKSLIGRTIEDLVKHDLTDIVVVVPSADSQGKKLTKLLKEDGINTPITIVEQPVAKGMGDAVLQAKSHLKDRFFVIYPYHFGIGKTLLELAALPQPAAVCSITTNNPWNYGILSLDGDRAVGLVEKPQQGSEPSDQKVSLYLLNQQYLDLLTTEPEAVYNFEAALNKLMQSSEVGVLRIKQPLTLKYPWHLFTFQKHLFKHLASHIDPSAYVAPTAVIDQRKGPVYIAAGAVISHAARVAGPCYIGPQSLVGDFTLIRESSLEEGVQIGSNTEVVRSIVFAGSSMHYGYLADSIMGKDVKIAAGLITANKRLDRRTVRVKVKNQMVDSQQTSLGIIAGNEVKFGIGVRTMPGVCIGPRAIVYPSQSLFGNVDSDQVIK